MSLRLTLNDTPKRWPATGCCGIATGAPITGFAEPACQPVAACPAVAATAAAATASASASAPATPTKTFRLKEQTR